MNTPLEHSFLSNLAQSLLPGAGGIRVFQQTEDNPAYFREFNSDGERLFTQAELDAVSEYWQVIRIVYEQAAPPVMQSGAGEKV